jgi:hypothetical protein
MNELAYRLTICLIGLIVLILAVINAFQGHWALVVTDLIIWLLIVLYILKTKN